MAKQLPPSHQGFSFIELMVTLALMAILATAIIPVAQMSHRRAQEQELRFALFTIRNALDTWKQATDSGSIPASLSPPSGYPPSLKALVNGVQVATNQPIHRFLRAIPRDPFCTDPTLPNDMTWQLRSYASSADAPAPGEDVYDVHSKSTETGLNGIPYREW